MLYIFFFSLSSFSFSLNLMVIIYISVQLIKWLLHYLPDNPSFRLKLSTPTKLYKEILPTLYFSPRQLFRLPCYF